MSTHANATIDRKAPHHRQKVSISFVLSTVASTRSKTGKEFVACALARALAALRGQRRGASFEAHFSVDGTSASEQKR